MSPKHIIFYKGISTKDRVTIFTPPGEFDADTVGDVYDARIVRTEQALVVEIMKTVPATIATDLALFDDIVQGKKDVWISHLHPRYGYILDQCKLDFSKAGVTS